MEKYIVTSGSYIPQFTHIPFALFLLSPHLSTSSPPSLSSSLLPFPSPPSLPPFLPPFLPPSLPIAYTSKRYSVGARLSGRTRYWCNKSVITRCNLAVSDMYMSVFGKDASDSLYVLLCRYIRSQATYRYISRSAVS